MVATPRVVVIGAGIVGAALADQLSARGWTGVTVLEQGPLPRAGGSTSHAPGLVFQTNASRTMTALARRTVARYTELGCFDAVGGLELATTRERLADLHRRQGLAAASGVDGVLLDPAQCARAWPGLDTDAVLGGFATPSDGVARAVDAVRAQLAAATARGVRVVPGARVTAVEQRGGRVTAVRVGEERHPADVVVSCAGFWGPAVGALAGVAVPLLPMAHQYVRTGPVPSLRARAGTTGATRPVLRHQDRDLYFRDDGPVVGIGSYAHRPMPVDPTALDPVVDGERQPSVLPFTPDDFAPSWADAVALLPELAGAGVAAGINGIFSFTPDGAPLLGETELAGFWLAEAVWVTHSAGAAQLVAQWLVDGAPEVDPREVDVRRFEAPQRSQRWVAQRAARQFVEVYDVVHPLAPPAVGRPVRTTPFHPRFDALGAEWTETGGWERPLWFAGNEPADVPPRDPWSARHWSPIAVAEAVATRRDVALYDMTPLRRIEVTGARAAEFLQWMTTGNVARPPGAVTYALLLDARGRVRSDVTVARLAEDRYQVGANTPADVAWLATHAPPGVRVADVTAGTCCLGLWGPRARDVLGPLADGVDALRYFRCGPLDVAGVPVTALRVSYAGELGWELVTTADQGLRLFDALWEAGAPHGLVAAGRRALDVLRLEKGYRSWGPDVDTTHTPAEAGLARAVRRDDALGDHLGRAAVQAAPPPARRLVALTLDDPAAVVLGDEPVLLDGAVAGAVTSAAWSPHVGRTIAHTWLPAAAGVGTAVTVQWFGDKVPATVAAVDATPLVDPDGTRVRG